MRTAAACLLATLLAPAAAPTAAEVVDAAVLDGAYQAEAGFDLWATDDVQHVTGTLRWHLNPDGRHLVSLGARAGGAWIDTARDDRVSALTLGVVAGYTFALSERLRPMATFAADLPLADGDTVDRQTTVGAGLRWQIGGDWMRDYALHLQAIRIELTPSRGSDQASYGLAIGLHQSRRAR